MKLTTPQAASGIHAEGYYISPARDLAASLLNFLIEMQCPRT